MWHWGGGTGIPLDFHIYFEQSLHFYHEDDQFVVKGDFHFSSCSKLGGFTKTFRNYLATSLLPEDEFAKIWGTSEKYGTNIHHFFPFFCEVSTRHQKPTRSRCKDWWSGSCWIVKWFCWNCWWTKPLLKPIGSMCGKCTVPTFTI